MITVNIKQQNIIKQNIPLSTLAILRISSKSANNQNYRVMGQDAFTFLFIDTKRVVRQI